MSNAIRNVSFFDRLIMFIRKKDYLMVLDSGCNPEITFENGEIYACPGHRKSGLELEISRNSIKLISSAKLGRSKSAEEIIEIIRDDLQRDKITTLVRD